ncbi:hypothetical protein P3X46_030072 [Hevea brasiliensis]|uniref:Uncharacterized protein n=1 Tax=Hevea brasiliensis TaxID=3981 RepID=A0ABQ9KVE3_HEVBR|nr:hypothetical protein P3X46_030072 [Hevea brasiliensis]
MSSAVIFLGEFPKQTICFKAMADATPTAMPFRRSSQLVHKNTKMGQRGICLEKDKFQELPLNFKIMNEKMLKELDEYISDDCHFEDSSPIHGKSLTNKNELPQKVMHFYHHPQNVKFSIGHVCENDEFTAGVNWHMRRIPFTSSFYKCSQEGDRLESSGCKRITHQPGGMVLTLLKNVTSHHAIVQFLMKIYPRLLTTIIHPLPAGYIRIRIWDFMARLFIIAISMLINISKKYIRQETLQRSLRT